LDLLKGIDVSRWQGTIDWNAVKAAGYDFAFIKITGADSGLYTDRNALGNVAGAKNAGLVTGGYHYGYFKNTDDAKKEADYFKSVAANLGLSYVVLDIEYPGAAGDLTQASIAFLDSIASIAEPLLYANPSFISSHLNASIIKYPLWIANYGVDSPSVPLWPDWSVWQQRDNGNVSGIVGNVDIDVMKSDFLLGGENMLDELIIYNTFEDIGAARMKELQVQCPIISRESYNAKPIKAKSYIVIGGTWKPSDGVSTLLSGADAVGTFKAVANSL
jgi:lysozyme